MHIHVLTYMHTLVHKYMHMYMYQRDSCWQNKGLQLAKWCNFFRYKILDDPKTNATGKDPFAILSPLVLVILLEGALPEKGITTILLLY